MAGVASVDLVALLVKLEQLRDNSFGGQALVRISSLPEEQLTKYSSQHHTSWWQIALALKLPSPPPGHT